MGRRTAVCAGGVAILLVVGTATALAATTLGLDPSEATPGTRVIALNACAGVTAKPPLRLAVAFIASDATNQQPKDPPGPRSVGRRVASYTYAFIVPNLAPGDYGVVLECLPGDWRTNLAEGAPLALTVLAGPPGTSTISVAPVDERHESPLGPILALGSGLVGGVAAWRRGRPRAV